MLPTDRLEYDLPERLIATHPSEPRDASRMMVVSRTDPDRVEHRSFRDLPAFLAPTDVLVRNRSAVLPARIAGRRTDSGGRIEGLFLEERNPGEWNVMLRSNGKLREGQRIALHHPEDHALTGPTFTISGRGDAGWIIRLESDASAAEVLDRVGATPLPPYILSARRSANDLTPDQRDRADYQTVYADESDRTSVAAPTAGLHFTPELIRQIDALGVQSADVLLRVGAGTFAPVTSNTVEDHPIHSERISVPARTIDAIAHARAQGGRSVVVGTTTVRALESLPPGADRYEGPTELLITPGFDFQHTDALVTNFHLPRSTLLAMVGAFLDDGDPVGRLIRYYKTAIDNQYRFYSFGDAMLILP